ncbi:MAG: four helix bundle protein [Ignavibacterium sp.]|jgi:four helix bundle protein
MIREKPHKKLRLWQKIMDLVVAIYQSTQHFPKEEEYGLKAQLRRAAVSVPSNVSEGLSRKSKKDKLHFLNIAQASLSEIDSQLEVSDRLRFLGNPEAERAYEQLTDVEMMLNGLMRGIRD